MSWAFTGFMKRARDFEREQLRRLNEAYARWHKKHRELRHGQALVFGLLLGCALGFLGDPLKRRIRQGHAPRLMRPKAPDNPLVSTTPPAEGFYRDAG